MGGGDDPRPGRSAIGLSFGDDQQRRRTGRLDRDRARTDRLDRRDEAPCVAHESLPRRRSHARPAPPPADLRQWSGESRRRQARLAGRALERRTATQQRPQHRPAPQAVHAGSCGDRRPAPLERDAAGDLLHLQPQPVRRSGPRLLRGWRAVHRRRRAATHQRHRRFPARPAGSCRPRRARVRRVRRPARGRNRRPPCRDGAAVQGGGRTLLRRRPGEGRVRH